MKFRIKVGPADKSCEPHWEEYDENIDDARKWAVDIIAWFNSTAQPEAVERILLDVQVLDLNTIKDHDWIKQNLTSIMSPQGIHDIVKCERCSVVARRYGMTTIVRQTPYRAKKFARCDTAMKALQKS